MKSSRKGEGKILGVISTTRAERLLLFLANSFPDVENPRWRVTAEKLCAEYPDVFRVPARAGEDEPNPYPWQFNEIAGRLRNVWNTADARRREWYLFQLRQYCHYVRVRQTTLEERAIARNAEKDLEKDSRPAEFLARVEQDPRLTDIFGRLSEEDEAEGAVPDLTPMEAALFHLQRIGDRARRCLNIDCPAPYFIATKRWQRYCSPECALPAQREAKRRWWNENRAKGEESE